MEGGVIPKNKEDPMDEENVGTPLPDAQSWYREENATWQDLETELKSMYGLPVDLSVMTGSTVEFEMRGVLGYGRHHSPGYVVEREPGLMARVGLFQEAMLARGVCCPGFVLFEEMGTERTITVSRVSVSYYRYQTATNA